ncbi:MAG: hypothetical protein FJ118_07135 [Deltaproteobacteria bacterium]|nr:hypothetical protein [Deltaproteobacteria bacterium]
MAEYANWTYLPAILSFLGALISGFFAWRQGRKAIEFQRHKWLLDRVVTTSVQVIDYLVDGCPPGSALIEQNGKKLWETGDFNGRMASLKHVPARLSELIFYRRYFRQVTEDLGPTREEFTRAMERARQSTKSKISEKNRNGEVKDWYEVNDLPEKIDEARCAVERYLAEVSDPSNALRGNQLGSKREHIDWASVTRHVG